MNTSSTAKFKTREQLAFEDEEPCPHGQRAGIVTNQPEGYDGTQPHCSVTVCPDPSCRAMGYVHRVTGQHATYVSDSNRRKQP